MGKKHAAYFGLISARLVNQVFEALRSDEVVILGLLEGL